MEGNRRPDFELLEETSFGWWQNVRGGPGRAPERASRRRGRVKEPQNLAAPWMGCLGVWRLPRLTGGPWDGEQSLRQDS